MAWKRRKMATRVSRSTGFGARVRFGFAATVSGLTRTARGFEPRVPAAGFEESAARAVSRTALGFAPRREDGFRFDIGALYPVSGRRQRLKAVPVASLLVKATRRCLIRQSVSSNPFSRR